MKKLIVSFVVQGRPASAGSKTTFRTPQGKVILAPASKYTKPWVEAVKWAVIQKGFNGKILYDCPIHLRIEFILLRPQGHYKKDGSLKNSARIYATVQPDLTKLIRSTEDALTGLVWRDDKQVIQITAEKTYGEPQGAIIIIEKVGE